MSKEPDQHTEAASRLLVKQRHSGKRICPDLHASGQLTLHSSRLARSQHGHLSCYITNLMLKQHLHRDHTIKAKHNVNVHVLWLVWGDSTTVWSLRTWGHIEVSEGHEDMFACDQATATWRPGFMAEACWPGHVPPIAMRPQTRSPCMWFLDDNQKKARLRHTKWLQCYGQKPGALTLNWCQIGPFRIQLSTSKESDRHPWWSDRAQETERHEHKKETPKETPRILHNVDLFYWETPCDPLPEWFYISLSGVLWISTLQVTLH